MSRIRRTTSSALVVASMLTLTAAAPVGAQGPEGPDHLQVGDLLFVEGKSWVHWWTGFDVDGWDHVALYIGNDECIEATDYPGSSCVRVTPLALFAVWAEDMTFGRVTTATPEQREAAVEFAFTQLGRPYQDAHICWWANADPDDPDDPFSDCWYCAELVWAAYLHQGINIDADPTPPPPEEGGDGIHLYVSPQEIADDDDVELYGDAPPAAPTKPEGPADVLRFATRLYSTSAIDPENESLYYQWDWGDSTGLGPWYLFPRGSGETVVRAHTWLELGTHNVKVRARDLWGNIGPWSPVLPVTVRSWFDGGGGGGVACFPPGSRVTMADGSMTNIEEVRVGDAVRSYDRQAGREIIGIVSRTLRHEPAEMGAYYLVINGQLRITPNHLIYHGGDWIRAGDVTLGCALSTTGVEVTSVRRVFEPVPTYHLVVGGPWDPLGMQGEGEGGGHPDDAGGLPYYVEDYLTNKGAEQESWESEQYQEW
ncbi:MAG: YiiX/YebB-like N1pC/P60 family cysteine hydrolase [Planctomycetota bacterium]|nr:YiiX/YebB-like N1pC/P60 family cysteine hydrolase [Planctomycetota bacterium]